MKNILENKTYKLLQGDCLKLMKEIPNKSIDMILCDLPYGTTACKWDLIIPFDKMWEQYNRIIKDNGAILLFATNPFAAELIMSNREMYRYEWVWDKEQGTNQFLKDMQPLRKHEFILVFYKQLPTYNPIMVQSWRREIKIRKETNNEIVGVESKEKTSYDSKGLKYPVSVLPINRPHWREGRFHPCQKPILLCEYLIKTYTNEGEVILDNCMGSGSTGVAALSLHRKFIGMELDEKYFQIAEKRIQDAVEMK